MLLIVYWKNLDYVKGNEKLEFIKEQLSLLYTKPNGRRYSSSLKSILVQGNTSSNNESSAITNHANVLLEVLSDFKFENLNEIKEVDQTLIYFTGGFVARSIFKDEKCKSCKDLLCLQTRTKMKFPNTLTRLTEGANRAVRHDVRDMHDMILQSDKSGVGVGRPEASIPPF